MGGFGPGNHQDLKDLDSNNAFEKLREALLEEYEAF